MGVYNSKNGDVLINRPAYRKLGFDAAEGVEPAIGDTITGATSSASGVILDVVNNAATAPTWAAGSGYFILLSETGTFQDNEDLEVDPGSGSAKVAVADGVASATDAYARIPDVSGWTLDEDPQNASYASSGTNCATQRTEGNHDTTGTMTAYDNNEAHADDEALFNLHAGESVNLRFMKDKTLTGQYYQLPALLGTFSTGASPEEGANVAGEYAIEGNGVLIKPDYS